jgi:hypothetical protein
MADIPARARPVGARLQADSHPRISCAYPVGAGRACVSLVPMWTDLRRRIADARWHVSC